MTSGPPPPSVPGEGSTSAPSTHGTLRWNDHELPHPGLLRASVGATLVQLVTTVVGVVSDADRVRSAFAVVSVVLFFVGVVAFVIAFVIAAGRSRDEEVWFGGAFFLTGGVAAPRMRLLLLGSLAAQVVIGLVGASLAPFTALAFGVLVPLSGLGFLALYGARWGEFSPRTDHE